MDTDNSNNSKSVPPQPKSTISDQEENPNLTPNVDQTTDSNENPSEQQPDLPRQQSSRRTPFTNLSQIDADLALARTLQEQERAYMMLRMNHDGSDYGSWEGGSYYRDYDDDEDDDDDDDDDDFGDPDDESDGEEGGVHEHEFDNDEGGTDVNEEDEEEEEEDVFDVHARPNTVINLDDDDDDDDDDEEEDEEDEEEEEDDAEVEFDPGVYSSDEAYARALQEAEEREMAARLFALAGINDRGAIAVENHDHGVNVQDMWEEVDPDELSYEELIALGEVVGTESRGLAADSIASLPSINYKTGSSQNGSNDSCVICRLDYEDGETLTLLSCKHSYHSECINNWLKINKVCPVCSTEVSTSGNS